jgi:hypothetical protein
MPPPKRPTAKRRAAGSDSIQTVTWPVDEDGNPMAQISFTASELIPTGDYANVSVGPVTITKFVKDEDLADKLNELAETVEADCISEQRALVLESLQAAVEAKKNSK